MPADGRQRRQGICRLRLGRQRIGDQHVIDCGGIEYVGFNLRSGSETDTTIDSFGFQYVGWASGPGRRRARATAAAISTSALTVGPGRRRARRSKAAAISTSASLGGRDGDEHDDRQRRRPVVGLSGATGTAKGTTIESGGDQYVGDERGPGRRRARRSLAAAQFVSDDGGTGTATDTTIDSGGISLSGSGGTGTAISTTIESCGYQYVG